MCWEITLSGDPDDLDSLCQSLNEGLVKLLRQGKQFLLSSDELNAIEDVQAARALAVRLIEQISGAARHCIQSCTPIRFAGLARRRPDGSRQIFLFAESIICTSTAGPITVVLRHADGSEEVHRSADAVRELLEIARHDRNVATVLSLQSEGKTDWVNLFRIYEVVEDDCQGQMGIQRRRWASRNETSLFCQTAQSRGAIGNEARHAKETKPPPVNPMSHDHAKTLIARIVDAWLQSKRSESRPPPAAAAAQDE